MRKALGSNVKIEKDSTGAFISIDWTCPCCNKYNAVFYFTSHVNQVNSNFETDQECDNCHKVITIECSNPKPLFE